MKELNVKMGETDRKLSQRLIPIGINLVAFGIFAGVAIALRASVAPVRRGFFCDDLTIKFPIVAQTVKTSVQLAVTFAIAALIFAVGEFLCSRRTTEGIEKIRLYCFSFPAYLLRAFRLELLFLWGVVATSVLTDVIKVSVGMLRPNFLAICNPNITCTNSEDFGIYHTDYVCQSISIEKENSARSSFPSGHASQAAFGALFLVLYVQERLSRTQSFLLLPCIQLSLVSLALWTAMTRVSDYVHHPMDVLAGIIIGIGVGLAFGYQTIDWLRKNDRTDSDKLSEEGRQHLASMRSEVAADRSPNGQV